MSSASVVITVSDNFATAIKCLKRIIRFTPQEVALVAIDDASSEGHFSQVVAAEGITSRVSVIRNEERSGFGKSLNTGLAAAPPSDIIAIHPNVLVSEGWYEELIKTSTLSDLCATVTALADDQSIANMKSGSDPLIIGSEEDLESLNRRLKSNNYMDVPIAIPFGNSHCMWISQVALAVLGGYPSEAVDSHDGDIEFCARASSRGFIHLLSPNIAVTVVATEATQPLKRMSSRRLKTAFNKAPYGLVAREHRDVQDSLVTSAFKRASLLSRPLRILVDCRLADSFIGGTSRTAISLMSALGAEREVSVAGLLDSKLILDLMPKNVDVLALDRDSVDQHIQEYGKFDIVLKIGSVSEVSELGELWNLASRVAVLQLDFIGADNPSYHISRSWFRRYREAITATLVFADCVIFLSNEVMNESRRFFHRRLREFDVVNLGLGVDHHQQRRQILQTSESRILILGTSYAHKNHQWIIRCVGHLHRVGREDIMLTFAGAEPLLGGSRRMDSLLVRDLGLEKYVTFKSWLSEHELDAELEQTDLVVSASISEGFGLVPLEAAVRGVVPLATLNSGQRVHQEGMPFHLKMRSIEEDAETILRLLDDPTSRGEQLDAALAISGTFKWRVVSERLLKALHDCASSPNYVPESVRSTFFASGKVWSVSRIFVILRRSPLGRLMFPPRAKRTRLIINWLQRALP